MTDLNIQEIKALSQKANKSENYLQKNYLYQKEYEKFNIEIIKAAKNGNNAISFDFVNQDIDKSLALSELKQNHMRIYFSIERGQAQHNMYEYPLYLISKGFKVEIRESNGSHGYKSKSYFISW